MLTVPMPLRRRPMLALAGIAAIFCRSLSACRRPLHCRLVESEKPTASPQRSPETQIDYRSDGLGCRMLLYRNSWPLRTRRHDVISDFAWTFVHFCSCLPSMQIMTRPRRALHRQRNTPRCWYRIGLRRRRRPVSMTAKMRYKQTAESKPRSFRHLSLLCASPINDGGRGPLHSQVTLSMPSMALRT